MVRRDHTASAPSASAPFFLSLGVAATLFAPSLAWAEDDTPHEGARGMPALVNVGMPVPTQGKVALAGTAGYGFIDPVFELDDPAHRLRGSLGGAFEVAPFLLLGVDVMGRMDLFSGADDDEPNLYGEPRITGRFFMPASDSIHWGVELDTRIVGAEAPDIDFGAMSPSLRGLLGVELASNTWLGAQLGFHLDNSANALPPPEVISPSDRVTVGASTAHAIPWGVGVSHRLAGGTELVGEVGGQFYLIGDAPSVMESPWGLSVAGRHPVSDNLDVMLSADVSLSARPGFDDDVLVPVDPRAGVAVSAIWRFGVPEPEVVEEPEEEEEVVEEKPDEEDGPKEPEVETSSVKGTVVDEGGRPLPDAQVIMTREGAEPVEERTFANGAFEFKEIPEGPVKLLIKTPGYDEQEIEFKEGEERDKEVILYPSVPAGQVKGEVRDLKGNPILATITVNPGNKVVQVGADGTFDLELAPGRYTVKFQAEGHATQKRFIRVVDRGVVVLNIALTK